MNRFAIATAVVLAADLGTAEARAEIRHDELRDKIAGPSKAPKNPITSGERRKASRSGCRSDVGELQGRNDQATADLVAHHIFTIAPDKSPRHGPGSKRDACDRHVQAPLVLTPVPTPGCSARCWFSNDTELGITCMGTQNVVVAMPPQMPARSIAGPAHIHTA
jgi:hypothetical protein